MYILDTYPLDVWGRGLLQSPPLLFWQSILQSQEMR